LTVALTPLKHLTYLNPETLGEETDPGMLFRYIDIGTTGRGVLVDEPQSMTFESSPSRARRVLRPGDTILSTVRTYLRAVWTLRGRDDDLVASTGFVCLRPRSSVEPRFLGWLAQADVVVEEVVARSVGVSYPALNPSEVGLIKVPLPPLTVQLAISDFLDREIARVDALMRAKRQIDDLLEEELAARRERLLVTQPAVRWVPLQHLTDPLRPIVYGIVQAGDEFPGGVPYIKTGDLPELTPATLSRTSPEDR
jgi:type I restriction enzyme, S subunit